MRRAADEFGQTIVMVTHEPAAASRADQVLFLADGRIVGEMDEPTPEIDPRPDEDARGGPPDMIGQQALPEPAREQAPALPHIAGDRSRRRLRGRLVRARRHHQQGLRRRLRDRQRGRRPCRCAASRRSPRPTASRCPRRCCPRSGRWTGVAQAEGTVFGTAQIIGKDGKAAGVAGPPALGFGWTDDADLNPLTRHRRSRPAGPRRGRDRQDHRRRRGVRARRPGAHHHRVRVGRVPAGRDRRLRRPEQPRRGDPRGLHARHRPAHLRLRGPLRDRSTSAAIPACSDAALAARVEQVLPSGYEAVTGATARQGGQRPVQAVRGHLPQLPARLRRDRPVRRQLHHLQRLQDHRRPAHPPGRAPAGGRRVGAPGGGLGDPRGALHRPRSPRSSGSSSG